MRIDELRVDGFGVWKGLEIRSLPEDVTVFYGHNEAGKTTLMQFIRSIMFGFSSERREKYVPSVYGGLVGGSAEVISPLGQFEIQRHLEPDRLNEVAGDLTVTDFSDGTVHGRARLGEILSDIDESIFNNVFAIGLHEIQELNALNSTEAADMLYRLTSGVDRVSLVDVMRDLKKRREALWSNDETRPGRLADLLKQKGQLQREIDELLIRSKRWSGIAAETNAISRELQDIAASLTRRERESRLLEIAIQISERWQSRTLLTEQIQALGNLPDPREISVKQLDAINHKIAAQIERRDQILEQRRQVKQDALDLPINRRLWSQKARIDALAEHSPWIESLQRQADRLQQEIRNIENSMAAEVDGLGDQLQIRPEDVRDLGNRSLSSLKSAGKKLISRQEQLKRIQHDIERSEFELGQQQDRLNHSLKDHPGDSLEETNRYVHRLRRRIELEEKISKLQSTRHELERDVDEVVTNQVLPVGKLGIIGVVFIAGIVMIGLGLTNFFSSTALGSTTIELGVMLMLMGAVCGFLSMGLKFHWERIARDELDDFRHQMDVLRQQLKRAIAERDEIERQLPDSIAQWDLELKDAEGKLARLEELVPLENRFQSSQSMLEDLRRSLVEQQRETELAEKAWRAALRTAGLPESLEPLQLKEISQRSQRISIFKLQLDQYQDELNERNKELDTLKKRMETLFQDCGLEFNPGDLMEQLHQLTNELNEQRLLVETRKESAVRFKQLRSRLSKCKQTYDQLQGRKRRLLSDVGADTEDQYRQFEIKHQQRQELLEKRNNLTEQIAAALGNSFTEKDVEPHLSAYGHNGLEKRWAEIEAKIEEIREHQTRLHQQRGELSQEARTLAEDTRLDEARLELNAIEQKLSEAHDEWQVLATSAQMLDTIRERYESKRQPETLREASGYLKRLTDGHYTRIWTRLVGEELLVDNQNDETITVDRLSRGTREAVYLSLRLALIGAYARRGALLPMVMDDILVNFDSKRARAAAELLVEFSRNGYQLLMFTCHEHMADLFHSLDAVVKVLPHHKDVVESNAGPTDYRGVVLPPPEPEKPVIRRRQSVGRIVLDTDTHDPELDYELNAVVDDQQKTPINQAELVYAASGLDAT